MATSVTQGLSDEQAGGASYRIARRVTLADSMLVRAKLGPAGEGRVLDISETGMASQAHIPIQPGSKITVDFDIPDGGHVRTEAQVVWRTVDKRMGLRFLRMSEPTRLRLRTWIDTLAGPETVSAAPAEVPAKAESTPRNNNEFWHLIGEIKASKLYLESALALIVERAAELTGSTGAALAIGPPENMICRATLGDAPDVGTVINPDSKLTSECIRTRHTVHVVDTDTDPRVDPFVCRDLNMRSAVLAPSFPNKNDKNFTVVLEMFSSRARNFSAEQITKLEQLAEVAGVLALGDSDAGEALKAGALASAANANGDASENSLFAQDELDHLVDRFISDLKIGGPAKSSAPAHEAKAPAVVSKPSEVKKSSAFETSYSGAKTETFSSATPLEKPSAPKTFEKKAAAAPDAAPAKKMESRPKTVEKDLELVSLAESVSAPFTPKREAVERTEFTLGQHSEPAGSKVPVIAIAALVVLGIIGGGIYMARKSSGSAKPQVQAVASPPVAPVTDPNTSMTVTATPLPATKPNASGEGESAKKPSASEAKAEKESKRSEEAKEEPASPAPIVLASGKHAPTETLAPMAAPSISMPTGAAPPPADMPVSTSTPELAASARSTGVTPGVLIHRVSPKYPSSARSYALSGEVVLKGRITKEGNVDELKALSGNPLLSSAAVEAVRQWKYEPYKVDGKPIDMETTFRIQFAMPK